MKSLIPTGQDYIGSGAWYQNSITKTLSENFSIDLEQRRISPRMVLPIVTVLKGDAPYGRGYHNQEGGLLEPSSPSVEETREVPAQKQEEDEYQRRQAEGL
jgi:hypothetical protein